MSTQISTEMVDLDHAAASFLAGYIEAKAKIKEWTEKADLYAEQVKSAMGDSQVGLVNGKEVVRWTTVESRRIDTAKVRELLPPQVIDLLEVVSTSRRFTIVED
jgi:predicted phage-related endonuclease